jgi:hypothetical protein
VTVGARWPEGALAIEYDERAYQAAVHPPQNAATPDEEGPWGKQLPDYYYPFRGQALQGTLELQPRPLRLRARCVNELALESGRLIVRTHLSVEAEAGVPETLDFLACAPLGNKWAWRTEAGGGRVRSFEPLTGMETALPVSAVGSGLPLQAMSLLAAQPWGRRWRLTLAQPPRPHEPITLHFTCEIPRADGDRWNVPLLSLLGAGVVEGETTLRLADADALRVETRGLEEVQAGSNATGSTPWRTFRHGPPPISLTLRGPFSETSHLPQAQVRSAVLTVQPLPDHLRYTYRFWIENWRHPRVPVTVPAGMRLLATSRDGERVSVTDSEEQGGPLAFSLPVPVDDPVGTVHDFEIVYSLDRPAGTLCDRLEASTPVLPIEPLRLRRVWRLPPGMRPLLDSQCAPLP